MALDLGKLQAAKAEVLVNYLGEDVLFYARVPTAQERLEYRVAVARCIKADGTLDMNKLHKLQKKWAKRVLTGFRKGDLLYNGEELSPDDPEWIDKVWEVTPELIASAVSKVFEGASAETPFTE